MRLLSLHLRNFKGIREFTLDAQGNNISVYGDNARKQEPYSMPSHGYSLTRIRPIKRAFH